MKSLQWILLPVGLLTLSGLVACQFNSQTSLAETKTTTAIMSSKMPQAPVGYEWVYLDNMSDEFNQTQLDESKWRDQIPSWKGRPPAEFLAKNVAVADGYLQLKTSTHPNPGDKYSMAGAAVSGKHSATYGYFESKIKASKTRMSTTFWLHSDKHEMAQAGCGKKHSIEIDILEAIGGWYTQDWTHVMHSNTHYKPTQLNAEGQCEGAPYLSKGAKKKTEYNLSDGYHTFATWWVSPNLVHFYFDGAHMGTVNVSHPQDAVPFNGPMSLRMVSETYTWQQKFAPKGKPAFPSEAELDDKSINTIYYDYVRSYQLKPSANNLINNGDFEQFNLANWQLNNAKASTEFGHTYTHSTGLFIEDNGTAEYQIKEGKQGQYQLSFYANLLKGQSAKLSVNQQDGKTLAELPITQAGFNHYTITIDTLKSGMKFKFIVNNKSNLAIDTLALIKL